MFELALSPVDAKEFLKFQEEAVDKLIVSIKKYFSENSETIVNGLAAMNGNFSGLTNRR